MSVAPDTYPDSASSALDSARRAADAKIGEAATTRRRDPHHRLRIGFVGAGFISQWHARAIRRLADIDLVAICDLRRELGERFAQRHNCQPFTQVASMIQEADLDAAHVLVPPQHHLIVARELAENGVDVLVEKPAATTLADAAALRDLARSTGRTIAVGHNFLYLHPYQQLREDLQSGRLGRIDQITIHWNRELEQILHGPHGGWMFAKPENAFLEVAPHSLSQMIDLMGGEPDEFHVRADRLHAIDSNRSTYRRWVAEAKYDTTLVRLVWSLVPGYADHRIEVQGSLGAATADCEQWTYQRKLHSPYQADFNRFHITRAAGNSLKRQAYGNLFRYVAEKLHLSSRGHAYAESLQGSAEDFYAEVRGRIDDSPISIERAHPVMELAFAMADWSDNANDDDRTQQQEDDNVTGRVSVSIVSNEDRTVASNAGSGTVDAVVLGATGFIGRHLVDQLLADERRVRVVVRDASAFADHPLRERLDLQVGDLRDASVVRNAVDKSDVVYHLARAYGNTWADFRDNDIPLTISLAEASLAAGVRRFVYTSTIDSYYAGNARTTITEDVPLDPKIDRRKPYSRAKAASEAELLQMYRERQLPLVIFRPGIVLGQGATPYHWGVGMFHQGAVVHLWGDGRNKLPLVLVQDVAAAMAAGFDAPDIDGETFNLCGPPLMSAVDYVHAIEQIADVRFQVRPTAIRKYYTADMFKYLVKVLVRHPGRYCPSFRDWQSRTQLAQFDCQKACELLGWQPESNLESFIDRAIREPVEEYLF